MWLTANYWTSPVISGLPVAFSKPRRSGYWTSRVTPWQPKQVLLRTATTWLQVRFLRLSMLWLAEKRLLSGFHQLDHLISELALGGPCSEQVLTPFIPLLLSSELTRDKSKLLSSELTRDKSKLLSSELTRDKRQKARGRRSPACALPRTKLSLTRNLIVVRSKGYPSGSTFNPSILSNTHWLVIHYRQFGFEPTLALQELRNKPQHLTSLLNRFEIASANNHAWVQSRKYVNAQTWLENLSLADDRTLHVISFRPVIKWWAKLHWGWFLRFGYLTKGPFWARQFLIVNWLVDHSLVQLRAHSLVGIRSVISGPLRQKKLDRTKRQIRYAGGPSVHGVVFKKQLNTKLGTIGILLRVR